MFRIYFHTIVIAAILILYPALLEAIQFYGSEETVPAITYKQPNEGTPVTLQVKLWGNSIYWEQETTNGYTVMYNDSTEYWCYAILDTAGYYVPSQYRIGIDTPGA